MFCLPSLRPFERDERQIVKLVSLAGEGAYSNVYEFDEGKLYQRKIGRLPASLWEALEELKKDGVMQDALGPHLFQTYLDAKSKEWYDYIIQVTGWERDKYFDKL